MECLSGQIGATAAAPLKLKRWIQNISALRAGAFTTASHDESATTGRASIFGNDYLKVVVSYLGLYILDPVKDATDFANQWINQFNCKFFHRFPPRDHMRDL
jgi:hypothetical protein